jgi:hypothetical protein
MSGGELRVPVFPRRRARKNGRQRSTSSGTHRRPADCQCCQPRLRCGGGPGPRVGTPPKRTAPARASETPSIAPRMAGRRARGAWTSAATAAMRWESLGRRRQELSALAGPPQAVRRIREHLLADGRVGERHGAVDGAPGARERRAGVHRSTAVHAPENEGRTSVRGWIAGGHAGALPDHHPRVSAGKVAGRAAAAVLGGAGQLVTRKVASPRAVAVVIGSSRSSKA